MGSTTSYLRINVTTYALGIIFETKNSGVYKKILISAGHPDNSYTDVTYTTANEYNKYGEWYDYNGDGDELEKVITRFNPKKGTVRELMDNLIVRCDMHLYKNTLTIICEGMKKIIEIISAVPKTWWGYLLGASEKKAITA